MKLATYYGALVEVLCERSVTGGVACDVRYLRGEEPRSTVRAFITNKDHLTLLKNEARTEAQLVAEGLLTGNEWRERQRAAQFDFSIDFGGAS